MSAHKQSVSFTETAFAYPLVQRDIVAMASHVYAVSGDGDVARRRVAQALVSFGGQDWETRATGRKDFP